MKKTILSIILSIILLHLIVFDLSGSDLKKSSDLKKGLQLYKKRAYKEAKAIFLDIIKKEINNYAAYFYLGKTSKILGDNDNAILALQRASELQPDNIDPYIELAEVYLITGHYDLAEKYCVYVFQNEKENDRYFYILGQIYYNKEDYKKAKLSFQKACKYNPENAYYYNFIGLTYLKLNESNKANTAFLTAIALNSNEYFFYFNLGLSYENLGNWEKAENSYIKCLKLNKDYTNAKTQLEKVKRILKRNKNKSQR